MQLYNTGDILRCEDFPFHHISSRCCGCCHSCPPCFSRDSRPTWHTGNVSPGGRGVVGGTWWKRVDVQMMRCAEAFPVSMCDRVDQLPLFPYRGWETQPNSRGENIPIITIPIKSEMTISNIGSLDPGTNEGGRIDHPPL